MIMENWSVAYSVAETYLSWSSEGMKEGQTVIQVDTEKLGSSCLGSLMEKPQSSGHMACLSYTARQVGGVI